MNNVIESIKKNKIIVIVRGVAKDKIIPLAEAMYNGGIRLIECTYQANGSISDEEIADNIRMLAEHFGDKMYVGAGTVLTKKQVQLTKQAGGKFIISPDANEEVIKYTKEIGLISMPGALTPTEIAAAKRAGADFVKVFPIDVYGPSYLKAVKAPLSNVELLAVGGINKDNLNDYLSAGAIGVGVGAGIVNKGMIESEDYDGITRLAEEFTKNI